MLPILNVNTQAVRHDPNKVVYIPVAVQFLWATCFVGLKTYRRCPATMNSAIMCRTCNRAIGKAPENVVGLQEHAHPGDHPGAEPPEVRDGPEGPWLHVLLVGALQQRAGQPLVLRAACSQPCESAQDWAYENAADFER